MTLAVDQQEANTDSTIQHTHSSHLEKLNGSDVKMLITP